MTFTDHSPAHTTFLMAIDGSGALASARALSVEQVGAHLDVEPAGALAVVAGPYETDFGSGPHPAELSKHPIAQLDAAGDEVWSGIVGAGFLAGRAPRSIPTRRPPAKAPCSSNVARLAPRARSLSLRAATCSSPLA